MQSQQMNPEEHEYGTFEPLFSRNDYGEREHISGSFGEKLNPMKATRKRGRWLRFRIALALISLVLLFVLSQMMLMGNNGVVGVLLVSVSIFSINIIVHLLSRQQHIKGRVRQFGLRLALALISGALLFPLSTMMVESDNGIVGILLVWVSVLSINLISYLTAFSKHPDSASKRP